MRPKTLKLVVTFHTTAAAMAMEALCKAQNLPGRLIPTPRKLTADCGMAWCAPLDAEETLRAWRTPIIWNTRTGRSCWSEQHRT